MSKDSSIFQQRRTAPCKISETQKITQFVLDVTLWRIFAVFGSPLRKLVSLYIFSGRSVWALAVDCQRLVYRAIGWLSAPTTNVKLLRAGLPFVSLPRRWHYALAVTTVLGAIVAVKKRIHDATDKVALQKRALMAAARQATSYNEWLLAATKLKALDRRTPALAAAAAAKDQRLYDSHLLAARLRLLQMARAAGDLRTMMDAIRPDLIRNLANMTNRSLHDASPLMPEVVQDYIAEVKLQLDYITRQPGLPLDEKLSFLRETRHTFGRSALVLSGGGSLGVFHLGIVKALFENGLLPKVLSGSSVGSIISAIIATRNDEELSALFKALHEVDLSFFSSSTFGQFVRHVLLKGTLHDHKVLQKRLRIILEDVTFLDAYNKSGRILNVAVCAADTNEPPRLLNYLTAPNVVVWSAVSCSSAFPGLFKPQDLLAKDQHGNFVRFTGDESGKARRWRDGSLEEDLPMRGLAEMFNVNYFICSQTNPHIVPALNIKRHLNHTFSDLLEYEFKHRCKQLHMLLPSWLPGGYWLKVLSQPWEGDVTMVLPSMVWQIKKAISNPTKEELHESLKQGEKVTWTKLSAIQAACSIELAFDRCLAFAKAAELAERESAAATSGMSSRSGRLGGMRSRIPSWSFLTSTASLQTPESLVAAGVSGPAEAEAQALPSLRAADHVGIEVLDPPDTVSPFSVGHPYPAGSGIDAGFRASHSSPSHLRPMVAFGSSSSLVAPHEPPITLPYGYSLNHLSRSSGALVGVPRVTSLDRLQDGCHYSGAAPDLSTALRIPAEAYPPLPLDCCDSSAAVGSIWDPVLPALGEGRPETATSEASYGLDYYGF